MRSPHLSAALGMLAAALAIPTVGREGLIYRASSVSPHNIKTFPSRRYLAKLRYAAQHPGRR